MNQRQTIEELFCDAIEIQSSTERQEFVESKCGDDADVRAELERLITAYLRGARIIDAPIDAVGPTVDTGDAQRIGSHVGPYRLLQKIGEGGFGMVFMAEQSTPVKRKVALKLIKPGMDSTAVVARFEAERQALAMMEHSHIAKVFDGGATAEGRPFFVMELVKGVPITTYCDDNRLCTRDRLRLFIDVCRAVQHAHHKGIIHRDIKPSNVMVTLHDGQAVVKVIDFGVAKAMHSELTEKTLFTAYGQMIGTPQYMSPEQAEMSGLDVDTRSDVYSLGVLLYEVLTGSTPLEADVLKSAGFVGMQRMIRETQPLKPSARLSSQEERLTHLAEHRSVSPERLHRELRGDLDWIVMKALEKERGRRYETANGLARDIERYLNGDEVEARALTIGYRIRRFATRNRYALAVASMLFSLLTIGLILVSHSRNQALLALKETNEQRNRVTKVLHELRGVLTDNAFDEAFNGDVGSFQDTLNRLRVAEADPQLIDTLDGISKFTSGDLRSAVKQLGDLLAQDPNDPLATAVVQWGAWFGGDLDRFFPLARSTLRLEGTQSDYVKLFAAMQRMFKPGETLNSIRDFDQLIEQQSRWGIAYKFRSNAYHYLLTFTNDVGHLRHSISDSQMALALLPKSELVKANDFWVHLRVLAFAELFPEQLSGYELERSRRRCQELANHFATERTLFDGVESAYSYFLSMDDPRAGELGTWLEVSANRDEASTVHNLYTMNRLEELVRLDLQGPILSNRAFQVLAIREVYGERAAKAALAEAEAIELANDGTRIYSFMPAYFLLGEFAAAKRVAAVNLRQGSTGAWVHESNRYYHGDLTDEEFLAKAGAYSVPRCHANFAVGLRQLANGNREMAKRHFEAALQTGRYRFLGWIWSRAFLQRMEADPAFPNWIPASDAADHDAAA